MKVLYFSLAADVTGCREEEWDSARPLSPEDFWAEAVRRHPGLAGIRGQCRLASGMDFVGSGGQLDPAQVAAVIPPVCGG